MKCNSQKKYFKIAMVLFVVLLTGCEKGGKEVYDDLSQVTENSSNGEEAESGSAGFADGKNDVEGNFRPEDLPALQSKLEQAPEDAVALFWANPPYEESGSMEFEPDYGVYYLAGLWPDAKYCIYDAEAVIDENGNITDWKKGTCEYQFRLKAGDVEILHLFVPEGLPNQLLYIESDYGTLEWPIQYIEGEHVGAYVYINSDGTAVGEDKY